MHTTLLTLTFLAALNANAQSTTLSSLYFDTSGLTGSMTATYLPSTPITATVPLNPTGGASTAVVTVSSSLPSGHGPVSYTGSALSSLSFDTSGVTGSMTLMPTTAGGSLTATATATGSGSVTVSPATTKNAQDRVGLEREVMGFAGLVAGLVALVV